MQGFDTPLSPPRRYAPPLHWMEESLAVKGQEQRGTGRLILLIVSSTEPDSKTTRTAFREWLGAGPTLEHGIAFGSR